MSATALQIEANRANALHSTGPTSPAGKARSARNALSHGLTSKDLFVPAGQEAEFEAFKEDLRQDLYPEGPAQFLLFNHILSASWRLLRCDRAEAGLAARTSEPGLDPLLDPTLEPTLRTIERARAQASKELHKSIAELRKVQTEHEYRAAAMPEDEGYDTACLGLGDWQNIRARMKKERAMDAANLARDIRNQQNQPNGPNEQNEPKSVEEVEALMDLLWEQELERIRLAGLDKTNPNPQVRQMLTAALNSQVLPRTAKTNPSAATAAA